MSRSLRLPTFPGLALIAVLVAVILLAVSQSAAPVHGDATEYADGTGTCNGLTPCHTGADAIQDAVDAVDAGGTVNVFPGTYAENVDLFGAAGGLTLMTVGPSGTPTPGTVTVDGGGGPAFFTSSTHPGNVTIDGFIVASSGDDGIRVDVNGDVVIANVTANNTAEDGVDLESNNGSVIITNSNADGNGVDGFHIGSEENVTISGSGADGNGDDGFDIDFASGDVTISGSTANGNGEDGFNLEAGAKVTITGSTANDNGGDGFDVDDTTNVSVTKSHADGNGEDGFDIDASGNVDVSDSSADGNFGNDGFDVETSGSITVTNSTANDNVDEGFELDSEQDISIDGVTALRNGDDGVDLEEFEELGQNITVVNSNLRDNSGAGLDIDDVDAHSTSATYLVNGNIICGNAEGGLEQNSAITTDATANWWGDALGPDHPDNPDAATTTGDAVIDAANPASSDDPGKGTVNFDPWIDTVSGSAAAATAGASSAVSFQFSDTGVFLGQGPGDPNGSGTFDVTTTNGTVAPSGAFINKPNGTLEVTLTPASAGTATVTVTGPCGLSGSVTLDVAAAPVVLAATATPAPTATPVTPVALPVTGGTPSDGGSGLAWLALAIGALIVTSGGLALAYQRRRVR